MDRKEGRKEFMAEMDRKKKKKQKQKGEFGKNIVKPNNDVLSEILLRLPASSVWSLRGVCKSWHSLTTDPSFFRRHTRRHCDPLTPKSMLFQCDPSPNLNLCILDADIRNNQILRQQVQMCVKAEYAPTTGPHLPTTGRPKRYLTLQLSCDGLLCFQSYGGTDRLYYICNLLTKTWTTVATTTTSTSSKPPLLRGFYFHPSTGEYRLLLHSCFDSYNIMLSTRQTEGVYDVATVNGGENKPRRVYHGLVCPSNIERERGKLDWTLVLRVSWNAPLVMDGNLHWIPPLDNEVGMVVFDTSSEKFRSIPIPFEITYRTAAPDLFKIGGNLCVGRPCPRPSEPTQVKMELWLLKDYNNQQWAKMHTIISNKGIPTSPSEDVAGEEAGHLLYRWKLSAFRFDLYNLNGSQISLYDLKRKTFCHIHIEQDLRYYDFVDYTESLVTV